MVDKKLAGEISYLSAIEEGRYVIAQANALMDPQEAFGIWSLSG